MRRRTSREAVTSPMQSERVDDEDPCREASERPRRDDHREGGNRGDGDGDGDRERRRARSRSARRGGRCRIATKATYVMPSTTGSAPRKIDRCWAFPSPPTTIRKASRNDAQTRTKSTSTSTSRRGSNVSACRSEVSLLLAAAGALVEVAEEAAELDEEHEREEHADRRDARVVEHVVGEPRRAERRWR